MRKKLLKILLSLSPLTAFASAKISIRPQYHTEQKAMGGTSGISIYQGLFGNFTALNMWAGAGMRPGHGAEPNTWWAGTNLGLDFNVKKWIITPGVQFRYSPTFKDQDNSISVALAYKLW